MGWTEQTRNTVNRHDQIELIVSIKLRPDAQHMCTLCASQSSINKLRWRALERSGDEDCAEWKDALISMRAQQRSWQISVRVIRKMIDFLVNQMLATIIAHWRTHWRIIGSLVLVDPNPSRIKREQTQALIVIIIWIWKWYSLSTFTVWLLWIGPEKKANAMENWAGKLRIAA